jgi:predicted aspartyl protease
MKFLGFPHEIRYPAGDQNAYVNLRFPDAKVPFSLRLLLDTGAGVTVLDRKLAKHLNVPKITSSRETVDFTLADKSSVRGYIHPIRVEFLGKPLTIDVAFVPTKEMSSLIGMRGFFDKMQVAFDHAARRVHVAFT